MSFLAAIKRDSVISSTEWGAPVQVDLPLCETQRVGEIDRAHTTRNFVQLVRVSGTRNKEPLMARARCNALMLIVR
jgi:hypothetical protein